MKLTKDVPSRIARAIGAIALVSVIWILLGLIGFSPQRNEDKIIFAAIYFAAMGYLIYRWSIKRKN